MRFVFLRIALDRNMLNLSEKCSSCEGHVIQDLGFFIFRCIFQRLSGSKSTLTWLFASWNIMIVNSHTECFLYNLFKFSVLLPYIVVSIIIWAIFVVAVAAVTITLAVSHIYYMLVWNSFYFLLLNFNKVIPTSSLCTCQIILLQSHGNYFSRSYNLFPHNLFGISSHSIQTMCRFY